MSPALSERGSKGGSCQLRSRNSFRPWNEPQSTSTRARSVSIKYFDPVTVPTPPQNEMLANDAPYILLRCQLHNFLRRVFHAVCHCEIHSRLANHTLTFFDVCTFEPNHHRHFDLQVTRGFNDTTRNH